MTFQSNLGARDPGQEVDNDGPGRGADKNGQGKPIPESSQPDSSKSESLSANRRLELKTVGFAGEESDRSILVSLADTHATTTVEIIGKNKENQTNKTDQEVDDLNDTSSKIEPTPENISKEREDVIKPVKNIFEPNSVESRRGISIKDAIEEPDLNEMNGNSEKGRIQKPNQSSKESVQPKENSKSDDNFQCNNFSKAIQTISDSGQKLIKSKAQRLMTKENGTDKDDQDLKQTVLEANNLIETGLIVSKSTKTDPSDSSIKSQVDPKIQDSKNNLVKQSGLSNQGEDDNFTNDQNVVRRPAIAQLDNTNKDDFKDRTKWSKSLIHDRPQQMAKKPPIDRSISIDCTSQMDDMDGSKMATIEVNLVGQAELAESTSSVYREKAVSLEITDSAETRIAFQERFSAPNDILNCYTIFD